MNIEDHTYIHSEETSTMWNRKKQFLRRIKLLSRRDTFSSSHQNINKIKSLTTTKSCLSTETIILSIVVKIYGYVGK